mmetsp:Transcript_23261/g.35704  ORF Transcript_23261/g.35704 Transcript_23261/m.35704 type:complete len:200 (-) Transcript_23261:469-1068(-)
MVHHNDLGLKRSNALRWVILRVRCNVTAAKILDGNILHIESNVVSRYSLREGFVMHLDRLDFGVDSCWGKVCYNARLDYTGFDTSNRNGSNTSNLVHILKWKTKCLIGWALWRVYVVKSFEKVWSLVPRHVRRLVNHVISFPSGDWYEWNLHWLVSNFLEVGKDFGLNFLVTSLGIFHSLVVHLVHGDNHLLHSKGVCK